MKLYWYAPTLRPPGYGGMPPTPKPLIAFMYPGLLRKIRAGEKYQAWPYAAPFPLDVVQHFDLALVEVEEIDVIGKNLTGARS